jgi:hypothetical protein
LRSLFRLEYFNWPIKIIGASPVVVIFGKAALKNGCCLPPKFIGLMKCFGYLYYAFYQTAVFFGNEGMAPQILAYMGSTSLLWLNFLTLLNIAELAYGKSLISFPVAICVYTVLFTMIYLYVFKNKRSGKILADAGNMKHKKFKNAIVFCYIVISLVVYQYYLNKKRGAF